MNIIISGWPAAGGSTLSILLAYLLEYKYLYGGGVMKSFARQVVKDDSGPKFIEFERAFGPYFDAIWEKYAIWKIQHSNNLILDGKAGGFFVEDENVFEIMVIAENHVRQQRADGDKRALGGVTLPQRDADLMRRWQSTYGINIFDAAQIKLNYDLILDTTSLSIERELEQVLVHLEEDYRYPESDLSYAKSKIPQVVSDYRLKGKHHFLGLLQDNAQLIDEEIIFKEWKHQFPNEVNQMPDAVKNIINS